MVLVVRPRAFAATPALVALFLFCSTTAIASPASTTGAAVRKWISSEGPSSNGTASLLVTQQEASDESILLKPVSVPKIVGKYCNANRDWGPIPDSPNKDFLGKVVRVVSFIRHGARIMCGGDQYSAKGRCWKNDTVRFDCSAGHDSISTTGEKERQVPWAIAFAEGTNAREGHEGKTATTPRNNWDGTCGLGQMTPDGYAMHRNNGDRFFEAYPKVFNSGSEEDGVESTSSAGEKWYIRSDVDASFRTLRSAETLVSRIIERGGGQGSSSNMANFRVHMDDQLYSTIQPNVHVCPRMGELEAEYWEKSPSVKKLSDKWDKEVRPELEAGLQADVIQGRPLGLGKDYGLFSVGDCVFSHRCSTVGRTTPAETPFSDTLLEKAFSYLPVYFGLNARHAKQRVGPLMTQVLGDLETKKEKNFLLYSGHDTGPLAPLLGAFEAEVETEWVWPPFASYINFEFTSDGLARVIYAGQVLKTKYCNDFAGNICKAETLLGRLRDLSPDYEKDCTLVGRIAGEGTKTSARNVELEDEMRIYQ